MAAVDYFLTLEGIDGETNDEKMIRRKQWTLRVGRLGVKELGAHSSGGGGGAGKVSIQDFHFTKKMDKAIFTSSSLRQGQTHPESRPVARKAGEQARGVLYDHSDRCACQLVPHRGFWSR